MWMRVSSSSPPQPKCHTQSMNSVCWMAKTETYHLMTEANVHCACDVFASWPIFTWIESIGIQAKIHTSHILHWSKPCFQLVGNDKLAAANARRNDIEICRMHLWVFGMHSDTCERIAAGETKKFYYLMCIVRFNGLCSWNGQSVIH